MNFLSLLAAVPFVIAIAVLVFIGAFSHGAFSGIRTLSWSLAGIVALVGVVLLVVPRFFKG